MDPEEAEAAARGPGRGLLGRLLYGVDDTTGTRSPYGPLTSVPLLGWGEILGTRCGCSSFIPILALLLFAADTILAIFAGLDAMDRGTARPWLQFAFSIAVAALYLTLFIASLVQYRWERVLRYRYHWVLALLVATVLSWTNFGVWASWQTRFPGFANAVTAADGNAFVTWVAANAIGVAGFLMRFVVLAMAQGLRYTYSRAIELNAMVVARTSGGQSLLSVVNSGGHLRAGVGGVTDPRRRSDRGVLPQQQRRWAGTQWGQAQRRAAGGV